MQGKRQAQELLKYSKDPKAADSALRKLPTVQREDAPPPCSCKCESCGWKLGCVNPGCDTKASGAAASASGDDDD